MKMRLCIRDCVVLGEVCYTLSQFDSVFKSSFKSSFHSWLNPVNILHLIHLCQILLKWKCLHLKTFLSINLFLSLIRFIRFLKQNICFQLKCFCKDKKKWYASGKVLPATAYPKIENCYNMYVFYSMTPSEWHHTLYWAHFQWTLEN